MKEKIIYAFYCLLIFAGGFVAGVDVSILHPNENYHASWSNVCLAIIFTISFTFGAFNRKK